MISIILTAYKEPESIAKAIEQILKNNLKDYELLVIAPDKETLDAAKKYSKKNKHIKTIKDPGEGKPTALDICFKKAKGDIWILTDGDVYVGENSLKPLLKYFKKDKKIGAVSGHPISLNPRTDMFGYWSHLLLDIAHKLRKKRDRQDNFLFCSGYLFALRKGIIEHVPQNALDDAYISHEVWQKGYKIKYEENAQVFIKNPTNFRDWIKQKKRNMYGEIQLKKTKKNSMRGFREELENGFFGVLFYPENIKEFFWTSVLIGARLYVWVNAAFNAKFKNSSLKKVWVRIESTK